MHSNVAAWLYTNTTLRKLSVLPIQILAIAQMGVSFLGLLLGVSRETSSNKKQHPNFGDSHGTLQKTDTSLRLQRCLPSPKQGAARISSSTFRARSSAIAAWRCWGGSSSSCCSVAFRRWAALWARYRTKPVASWGSETDAEGKTPEKGTGKGREQEGQSENGKNERKINMAPTGQYGTAGPCGNWVGLQRRGIRASPGTHASDFGVRFSAVKPKPSCVASGFTLQQMDGWVVMLRRLPIMALHV